jgi:hypothetical protein
MLIAYPRLRELPPGHWNAVLDRARSTAFDAIEWAGLAAGLAFTSLALQPIGGNVDSMFGRYVGQFLLALPLLAVLAGPILLRRTRRGLDMVLAQRNGGESWNLACDRQDEAFHPRGSARPE